MLGRYLDEHVNMIAHHMTFNDGAVFLLGQFVEDRSKKLSDLAIEFLFTVFGDEDHMILAVPLGMT